MSTSTAPCLVYFVEDVCQALGLSRRVLDRLRRHRAFPIPELPALDKRPRWAKADVEAFVANKDAVAALRGRHLRAVKR